jgi:hypothetical protein
VEGLLKATVDICAKSDVEVFSGGGVVEDMMLAGRATGQKLHFRVVGSQ